MIIKSFLDSDLYKLTQFQAVAHCYPNSWARYEFINRGPKDFPVGISNRIMEEVNAMRDLSLTDEEALWLKETCPYISPFFISYLKGFKYDPSEIVYCYEDEGDLKLRIEGPWFRTILWEVQIMAIISELYHDMKCHPRFGMLANDVHKFELLNDVSFADFGTRRRRSYENQDTIISLAQKCCNFNGTSNIHLAHLNDVKPIGTQAHEWFMFHGSMFGYRMANQIAMEKWVEVYQGNLGIALSDTFTTDAFFKAFTMKYAKLFDGVRQDSGDPEGFAEKVINHYRSLGINPKSKTIVFSDNLNAEKALQLEYKFCKEIKCSFGIGTNLTCDIPDIKPLNMVIKMTACKEKESSVWMPTVKLSDSPTKHTGDEKEIELCKRSLGID